MAKKKKVKKTNKKVSKEHHLLPDPRITSEGVYIGDGVYMTPREARKIGFL